VNLIIGKSKTVHNSANRVPTRDEDGTTVWLAVPSCSVAVHGKTVTETDAAVTCKTCAKTTPAVEAPVVSGPSHNAAACSVAGCTA
jgi:hypothetical protein